MEYEYYLDATITYRFKRAPVNWSKLDLEKFDVCGAWEDEVTIEAPDYTPSGLLETELRKHLALHFQQEGKKLALRGFKDVEGA